MNKEILNLIEYMRTADYFAGVHYTMYEQIDDENYKLYEKQDTEANRLHQLIKEKLKGIV